MNKPDEKVRPAKEYKSMEEMDRDILTEELGKERASRIMILAKAIEIFVTETENSIRDS